jgi:hypothetical protein
VHDAILALHAPKAHVVASGRKQGAPSTGATPGQTLSPSFAGGTPASGFAVSTGTPSEHPAATRKPATSVKTAEVARLRRTVERRRGMVEAARRQRGGEPRIGV